MLHFCFNINEKIMLTVFSKKIHHIVSGTQFLLMFCFSFLTVIANGEALVYTVMKGDDNVGEFRIDRKKINDITEYTSQSVVKVNMLVTIKVTDKMKVSYNGNRMEKAELHRTLNGLVRVNNLAIWNGSSYHMTNKDKDVTTLRHLIHYSTASLYFLEPSNIPSVFSENFQKMIAVKFNGNRKYTLELPNGNKTSYTYANGVCTLVEAETDWADIRFVLSKRIP
jgi:hypothetical protein